MSDDVLWIVSVAGALVCIGLLFKISRQWRSLDQHKQAVERMQDKNNAQRARLAESILILCRSILDEQVEISEGCMRIKILLDHYDSQAHEDPMLGVFNKVYTRLEKMPRFEQRKKVNRKLLAKLDETRHAVEKEHEKEVREACLALISRLPSH